MAQRTEFEKLDFHPLDIGVSEESTPVNNLENGVSESVVLDLEPIGEGEDITMVTSRDDGDENLRTFSSESRDVIYHTFTVPPVKEDRSNSLRSETSSCCLEVIEESPQVTPEESPNSSSESSPVEAPSAQLKHCSGDEASSQHTSLDIEDITDVTRLSVQSVSPSNSLFFIGHTSDQPNAETERETESCKSSEVSDTPGYADFDPTMFNKMFSIPDTQYPTSPQLVAVKSIVSISESEEEPSKEEDVYISPIPTPRPSSHQGSLKELQERRMAKQRLRSSSGSPADNTRVSRVSESYSPDIPRRLSLDVPDLSHTARRSPGSSPISSPVRSSRQMSDSSPLPEQSASARSTVESMLTSPNSRRRLSTQVRRSKAFATFFGSQPDGDESPVMKPKSRRMSLAQQISSSRKRSSVSQPKQKRRSTLTKIADAVITAFMKKSTDEDESAKRPKKEKVAQSTINRQISQPMETPSFLIDELSPDQEEAVIQSLPAQIIAPPLVRMGRGRRNSIMPGAEPPQVVMRKMDASKTKERPKSGGPKIDDVVFTVNTKGEMEMFEVVPVVQPTVPTG